jgi:hypothetical protein
VLVGCWLGAGWVLVGCWLGAGWVLVGCWLGAGWVLVGCWLGVWVSGCLGVWVCRYISSAPDSSLAASLPCFGVCVCVCVYGCVGVWVCGCLDVWVSGCVCVCVCVELVRIADRLWEGVRGGGKEIGQNLPPMAVIYR